MLGETLVKDSVVSVMDHEIVSSGLVVEGDTLGAWEVRSLFEENASLIVFTVLWSVSDSNWLSVVLLHLVGSGLEIWGEHSSLKGTASSDAIGGVKSSGWFLVENLLDLLDAAWDTGGLTNQFNTVDLFGC